MAYNQENHRAVVANKVMKIVSIIMAITYLAFGIWIILMEKTLFNLSPEKQRVIGIVFILYSFFRGFVLYRRYFSRPRNFNDGVE